MPLSPKMACELMEPKAVAHDAMHRDQEGCPVRGPPEPPFERRLIGGGR